MDKSVFKNLRGQSKEKSSQGELLFLGIAVFSFLIKLPTFEVIYCKDSSEVQIHVTVVGEKQ